MIASLSRGAKFLKVGGKVLFWVGLVLMAYDGANGSIEAVKNGDPLVDPLLDKYPRFANMPIFLRLVPHGTVREIARKNVGFARGVVNGVTAPFESSFASINVAVYGGLLKAPEGSWAAQAARAPTPEKRALQKKRELTVERCKKSGYANCEYYLTHDPSARALEMATSAGSLK